MLIFLANRRSALSPFLTCLRTPHSELLGSRPAALRPAPSPARLCLSSSCTRLCLYSPHPFPSPEPSLNISHPFQKTSPGVQAPLNRRKKERQRPLRETLKGTCGSASRHPIPPPPALSLCKSRVPKLGTTGVNGESKFRKPSHLGTTFKTLVLWSHVPLFLDMGQWHSSDQQTANTPPQKKGLKHSAFGRRVRCGDPVTPSLQVTPTQRDTEKRCRTVHSLQGLVREVRATEGGCQIPSKKYHCKETFVTLLSPHKCSNRTNIRKPKS